MRIHKLSWQAIHNRLSVPMYSTLPRPQLQRSPLQFILLHHPMLGKASSNPPTQPNGSKKRSMPPSEPIYYKSERVVNTKYYCHTCSVFGHSEDRCFVLHENYKALKGSHYTIDVSAPTKTTTVEVTSHIPLFNSYEMVRIYDYVKMNRTSK